MLTAIIDYGSGNLRSAAKAFERAAGSLNHEILVTSDAAMLSQATHIVLPGVGAFADCMKGLVAIGGMREAMTTEVIGKRKPFLGICVGMQMLFDTGEEHGVHAGLGWIAGNVVKIEPRDKALKVPHMGWNTLTLTATHQASPGMQMPACESTGLQPAHPLLAGIQSGDHAYFVHSYYAKCTDAENVLATTDYSMPITAIVAKGNIMGTQFHPEKSQETGLRLIENFLKM